MTDVLREPIGSPAAWRAADIDKQSLAIGMDAAVLAGMDALALKLKARPVGSITRADADHPAVNALMAQVRAAVMEGRGLALVRGPDPARWDPEDYERVYFALGTHLGRGVVQSFREDYVARVETNPSLPWRGTTTDMELRPHTDFHEVMSLASISRAEAGGVSGFVSSLAVHDEILRTRPELLEPLYEGWFNVSPLKRQVSAEKTPVFCCVDGKVSCFFNRVFWARPEEAGETALPADLAEAIAFMDELVARPDLRAEMMLEPGEMVFWHNFMVMHARTAFRDSPAHKRLLRRLWLNVPDGRPMAEEIRELARVIDRDHIEGRVAA